MPRTGGEAIAELLSLYGVRYVFGLPGGQTLSFYDAIAKRSPKIRHVLVRDEKSSVFMADGYSKVTFRPGVCDGTAGPGAANMLPSVVEAYTSSSPVIVLTSDVVTKWMGKGASQELDHFALFRPFVKANLQPRDTQHIPNIMRDAFRVATSGRPGPVHVDLPQDILENKESQNQPFDLSIQEVYSRYPSRRPRPDSKDILKSIDLILHSSKPIIFAGGGAILSQAWEEVRKFAELVGAPVVTTLTAKGIIPENHPLSLGCVGRQGYRPTANEAVKEADLVIALGTKFAQVATNNWTLIDEDRTKIIHIDIDPSELRKNYREEVTIVADAKSALLDLIEALSVRLSKGGLDRSQWVGKVANLKKEWVMLYERLSADTSEPLKAAVVFREIQKFMPARGVLVSSGSFSGAFAGCYYNMNQSDGRRFIQARGMAGTEAALPLAIGVSFGVQDGSKVIAVTGDGGFGYHIAELETARRMHLSLLIIVMNNNSLAWMKLLQRDRFGSNYISSQYSADLNYSKIAEAFGCKAARVENASELSSEISRAMKSDDVFVLEVMTDPDDCSSTHMAGDPLAKKEARY